MGGLAPLAPLSLFAFKGPGKNGGKLDQPCIRCIGNGWEHVVKSFPLSPQNNKGMILFWMYVRAQFIWNAKIIIASTYHTNKGIDFGAAGTLPPGLNLDDTASLESVGDPSQFCGHTLCKGGLSLFWAGHFLRLSHCNIVFVIESLPISFPVQLWTSVLCGRMRPP